MCFHFLYRRQSLVRWQLTCDTVIQDKNWTEKLQKGIMELSDGQILQWNSVQININEYSQEKKILISHNKTSELWQIFPQKCQPSVQQWQMECHAVRKRAVR